MSVGITVQVADPAADGASVRRAYGFDLSAEGDLDPADAVVVAVPHAVTRARGWGGIRPLLRDAGGDVLDVRGVLDRTAVPEGIALWRL